MDVGKKLKDYRDTFNRDFLLYFEGAQWDIRYRGISNLIPACLALIKDLSLRGGKRQRVAFLYEAYCLFRDVPVIDYVLQCAFSIELLQTHLLIHDDLIDNSLTRRNGLTTNAAARELLTRLGVDIKHSAALTILTGDIAAYMAIEVLLKADQISPDRLRKVIDIQIAAGRDTFIGQIFDLERDVIGNLAEDTVLELADYKAVRSSTLAPMMIGLVLSGADSPDHVIQVTRYATWVGIAGQLQDDILGLFGDPAVMGKSNISDVIEGKRTAMIMYALSHASKDDSAFIQSVLGNQAGLRGGC